MSDTNQTDKIATQGRLSKARKSTKTWINDTSVLNGAAHKTDAQVNGQLSPEQAVAMVGKVTKFATVMCVVIAVIKVGVYIKVQSAVVKTSALDSCGDLIANMITMYTGYRMAQVDAVNFPIGQSRFEPVGVLVFSTLMAAMMFGNAIGNVEELLNEIEEGREAAALNMFGALVSTVKEGEGYTFTWPNKQEGWEAFRAAIGGEDKITAFSGALASGAQIKEALKHKSVEDAEGALENAANWAGEVESPTLAKDKLVLQNVFLGCCATYKFCLWIFVALYAAPKTGSTVLVALANDKRNDFIATSFVIIVSTLTYVMQDSLSEEVQEKSDPAVSLILSSVIIYTWACLMREQIIALSGVTVDQEMVEAIAGEVKKVADKNEFPCGVKCYYSSNNQTIEVDMTVNDPKKPFEDVQNTANKIRDVCQKTDGVERVLVLPKLA